MIDYYSIRKSAKTGPEFYLDVRPASESFGNMLVRLMAAIEHVLLAVNRCSPARSAWFLGLIHILKILFGLFLFLFIHYYILYD